ncbi:MAG: hypothetical protein QM751_13025 [Paludibacteraceae bacterium]
MNTIITCDEMTIIADNKRYTAVEQQQCRCLDCDLKSKPPICLKAPCAGAKRKDKKNVIFKLKSDNQINQTNQS